MKVGLEIKGNPKAKFLPTMVDCATSVSGNKERSDGQVVADGSRLCRLCPLLGS